MNTTSLNKLIPTWLRRLGALQPLPVLAAVFALMATNAWATLIAYDPMNYSGSQINSTTAAPTGAPTQTTGGGWAGNWGGGALNWSASGLAYPSLPAANGSISALGANYLYTHIASAPASGSVWVSFLFKQAGDNGGNRSGVILENSSGTGVMLSYHQFSGAQGKPCLMAMSGTTGIGTEIGTSATLRTYANTNLYVLQFTYTAGIVSSISVYSDPAAGQGTTPSPDFTVSSGLPSFGALVNIGLVDGSAMAITLDEFRVADSFADAAGFIPPPAAPTGLTASAGINSVSLSWDATSGATGYKVLRGTTSLVYTVTNSVASNTNFDATAVGGTQYFYVVEATNSSGASTNSMEVSATPTIALPDAPTGLTATGTNGAVNLTWGLATGAASYNVKRSTTGGAEATITNVSTTSYSDTAVVNGTPYFYKVSSTNSAGESADSSEVSATPDVPPPAPTGLNATAGSNQVALAWTGSAGAASYNIKRSTTSGSGYSTIGTTTAPTVAYTDSTAVKFTQYYYVVSAVSAYGESANSSPEATATPTGAYGPSAYESFNYPLGTLANHTPSTASGFTGNWTVSGSPSLVAGLSYSNLTTSANSYQHSAAGSQTTVNFANPLSSGTKYISFLFKGPGTDPGGNAVGVFFKGNNATSLFVGFEGGYSPSQTMFGLGTVSSTTLGGTTALGSTTPLNNSSVHFIVLRIDFNTSGVNDTVSLWIDPPAGVITPGVPASVVNSTFDVGTISAFGININGAFPAGIDEIRVGDLYGDVAGYSAAPPAPTVATTTAISVAQGEQVSWTAFSTNSYQPQKSLDNITWSNFGGFFVGNAVASVYETAPEPYYRVQEFIPGGPGPDVMVNGSFETPAANSVGAANWSGPASTGTVNQYVTNQYDALLPTDGAAMLFMEGQGGSGSLVQSDLVPITGGLTYKVVFDAANPLKSGGGNPQFRVEFFDAGNAVVASSGFVSFASAGSSWVAVSNNYAAPANAATARIGFLQAVGAGGSDHWISLMDNVRISALATVAGINVLSPTVQLGAGFTATVQTNGVTATAATGTVTFKTNSVQLSVNTVAAGSAASGTAVLTPPYTVTAIYSGDSTYIGSTNSLVVNNAAAAVALGNLSQTYDGTARSATATTTPAGLTVAFTYDGSANAPTNAGTYQVIGRVVDVLYLGSATNNLVIDKGEATVTLVSLSQVYNGAPRSATATTTPPGLMVTFTYDGSPTPPISAGTYEVIGTVADINYQGSATNNLVVAIANYFGPGPGSVTLGGGSATVVLSGVEGLNYSVQRATNVTFTLGISNFPTATATAGGNVSATDDFSDLGVAPEAAFYRLQYIP
jgi:hypothetical protein